MSIVAIPGIVARLANAKPKFELITWDARSQSFRFKRAADASAFAKAQKFIADFGAWAADTRAMEALNEAENLMTKLRDARRKAA